MRKCFLSESASGLSGICLNTSLHKQQSALPSSPNRLVHWAAVLIPCAPRICSVSLGILFNDFLLSTHYTCLFVLLLLFLIAFRIHRIYKMHVWCSDKSVVWVVLNTFHKFNISKSGCFSFSTDTLSFALCLLLSASRSVGVWSGQFRCDMWQILDENGTPSHKNVWPSWWSAWGGCSLCQLCMVPPHATEGLYC